MRLISICPSNTELIAYLDLTSNLVAVDDFSDWPLSIKDLPRLGPDLNIDMDKLESYEPDLVVASLSVPGMEKNIEELKKREIPHIVLNPNSLQEIADDLLTLGKHTYSEKKANEVVEKFNRIITDYRKIANKISNKPKLYWEWWPKPVFTPGGANWLTEISELAGGENIFSNKDVPSFQTDWDEVYKCNPDHICLAWVGVKQEKMNPELVKKRPNWENLTAIKQNQIHLLEEQLYCRPSLRLLLGLQKLAARLHPDLYPPCNEKDPLL